MCVKAGSAFYINRSCQQTCYEQGAGYPEYSSCCARVVSKATVGNNIFQLDTAGACPRGWVCTSRSNSVTKVAEVSILTLKPGDSTQHGPIRLPARSATFRLPATARRMKFVWLGPHNSESTVTLYRADMPMMDAKATWGQPVDRQRQLLCQSSEVYALQCTQCSDVPHPYMTSNDLACDTWGGIKCNGKAEWTASKYCQQSCFQRGLPYAGDQCCPPDAPPPAEEARAYSCAIRADREDIRGKFAYLYVFSNAAAPVSLVDLYFEPRTPLDLSQSSLPAPMFSPPHITLCRREFEIQDFSYTYMGNAYRYEEDHDPSNFASHSSAAAFCERQGYTTNSRGKTGGLCTLDVICPDYQFDVTGSPTPALDSGQGFKSGSRSADPWARVPSGNVWAPVGGRLPDGSSNPYYIQVSGDGGVCAAPVPIDAEADAASTVNADHIVIFCCQWTPERFSSCPDDPGGIRWAKGLFDYHGG